VIELFDQQDLDDELDRRRKMARRGGGFSPLDSGIVSAWLRLQQGTIAGTGYSSIPDVLANNPAVQATDADRPNNTTSANGLPIMDLDGSTDFLSVPLLSSSNNQSVTAGFAAWIKPDGVSGTLGLWVSIPGAANRIELLQLSATLSVDIYISQFSSRRGAVASALTANVWQFITWEYDGGGANDAARCTLTVNGVVQTLTFSDSSGTPGAMPATLVTGGTTGLIGMRVAASHTGGFDGKIGPNIYWLGSKMSGATQGLFTTAARNSIMSFEQPT
jgi:hypothetical protein